MMKLKALHSRHRNQRFRDPDQSCHPSRSRNSEKQKGAFKKQIATRLKQPEVIKGEA
jgi:hypothetical protein